MSFLIAEQNISFLIKSCAKSCKTVNMYIHVLTKQTMTETIRTISQRVISFKFNVVLIINFLESFLSTEIKLPFCLQAKKICEVGLEVGSSLISCLGDPSMGKW